jgi:hypothetical protein
MRNFTSHRAFAYFSEAFHPLLLNDPPGVIDWVTPLKLYLGYN